MAASDTPDVPPIPVPPIEPAPKAKAAPAKAAAPKTTAAKPAAAKPAATKPGPAKPAATTPAATERPNPYAQAAPAVPQPYANGPYVAPPSQTLSIVSMILGIVGILFSFCYGGGFLFSLGAVITGHLATKREPHAKGFRLAGVITGYVGLGIAALWVIGLIVFFVILAASSAGSYGY